eukprot:353393-Chlamydomonas_euryale.AAC.10
MQHIPLPQKQRTCPTAGQQGRQGLTRTRPAVPRHAAARPPEACSAQSKPASQHSTSQSEYHHAPHRLSHHRDGARAAGRMEQLWLCAVRVERGGPLAPEVERVDERSVEGRARRDQLLDLALQGRECRHANVPVVQSTAWDVGCLGERQPRIDTAEGVDGMEIGPHSTEHCDV